VLRSLYIILLGPFFCFNVSAKNRESDSSQLAKCVVQFNEALVQQNYKVLKKLLDPNLKYIHSNNWVETKKTMLQNLKGGVIRYVTIEHKSEEIGVNEGIGSVNINGVYTVHWQGNTTPFTLKVIQIWKKHHKKWRLYMRQSEGVQG
jgi:hypothetical protein